MDRAILNKTQNNRQKNCGDGNSPQIFTGIKITIPTNEREHTHSLHNLAKKNEVKSQKQAWKKIRRLQDPPN